jgi:hypothetical protein
MLLRCVKIKTALVLLLANYDIPGFQQQVSKEIEFET